MHSLDKFSTTTVRHSVFLNRHIYSYTVSVLLCLLPLPTYRASLTVAVLTPSFLDIPFAGFLGAIHYTSAMPTSAPPYILPLLLADHATQHTCGCDTRHAPPARCLPLPGRTRNALFFHTAPTSLPAFALF